MVLDPQRWLEVRRFRVLHQSGAMSISEIARETGLNRRTVRKYLCDQGPLTPPGTSSRRGTRRQVVVDVAPVIDAMLRAEILIKGTVVHERLVKEYGFTAHYQRVKLYLQEARPRIAAELGIGPGELAGLHRRFEVVPGAQAQVVPDSEGNTLLATHPRAVGRGARVVDEAHWDGLPDGHTRRVTTGNPALVRPRAEPAPDEEAGPLRTLLKRAAAAQVEVGRRPLSVYDQLTGTRPFTTAIPQTPEDLR
ncbi:hypothetical protein [Streptomyces goshikiensis]|uniref:hypothetical protein n=1 Tax=Streptomyces goshikiensis TaxID=1942 RepID=UPI00369018CD